MKEAEYSFEIDAYNPKTFPMERLGQYIADLGTMLGEVGFVHFLGLKEGSTKILHRVEAEAIPKIENTIHEVSIGSANIVQINAFQALNKRLKEDNSTGRLLRLGDTPAQLLRFPGREEEDLPTPDIVVQIGIIDGVVISLGGKDNTVPVRVQDGDATYKCTASREIARLLGAYIFGDELRLVGEGKWLRTHDGEWHLDHFKIVSFEALDVSPLGDIVDDLRAIPGDWGASDFWAELQELRNGD